MGGAESPEGLSAVDEDSAFERWLTANVCEPVTRRVPRWVKPNTVSLLNVACNWTALCFAFLSVYFDESEEEYRRGEMDEGRDLWTARSVGFAFRLGMAGLTFASLVLDCVDGMHARATGQCSHLGEVVDHALDAANIPLIGCAFAIAFALDQYSVGISMVGCGYVFNSQLCVYRHRGRMVKPPTNGPESQMLVVTAEVLVSAVFFAVGRYNPRVDQVMVGTIVLANIIQVNNFIYFWRQMDSSSAVDHVRFCVVTLAFCALYWSGVVTQVTYLIVATMIAFRLSGTYVLYTVTNSYKRKIETAAGREPGPPLESPLTSMHDGWDASTVACVALFALAPHVPLGTATHPEAVLVVVAFVYFHVSIFLDLRHCLPYIAPDLPADASVGTIFF